MAAGDRQRGDLGDRRQPQRSRTSRTTTSRRGSSATATWSSSTTTSSGARRSKASQDDDHRKKVTLVWDPADVGRVVESYFQPDQLPALYLELPRATYATWQYDAVKDGNGQHDRVVELHRPASGASGRCSHSRSSTPSSPSPAPRCRSIWGEPDGGAKSGLVGTPPPDGDPRHGRPRPDRQVTAQCDSGRRGTRTPDTRLVRAVL